jgi:hypothetical protein
MARQATKLEVVAVADKWQVTEQGIGRLSTHETMAAATAAARAIAAIHTPCELIVRKPDGTIESEQTFHAPKTPKP